MKLIPRSKSAKISFLNARHPRQRPIIFTGISFCPGWGSAFAYRLVTDNAPFLVPAKDRPRRVLDWESVWSLCRKALLRLRASMPLVSRLETFWMVVGKFTMWKLLWAALSTS